jgi:DNA polymerase-3 subunit delta
MKIAARGIEAFCRNLDAKVAAILFYGPDAGLVHERADRLAAAMAGDAADPFRVSEVAAARLREEPSALADEAAALSFGGGRRVVRLRDATDAMTDAVERLLAGAAIPGLAILEAGELGPRSSLRRMIEGADNAAALPCYLDEGETLNRFIGGELRELKLSIAPEALEFLVGNLGSDRALTRRELEKLACYMGDVGNRIELADVIACIGDSAALTLDDLVFAVADGDAAAAERALDRGFQEGIGPVAVLRAAARHFLRLHSVAGAGDREAAFSRLRPPVFYKLVDRFKRQARRLTILQLGETIDRLVRAESDCKRTGMPAETICRRALLEIAVSVGAGEAARGGR